MFLRGIRGRLLSIFFMALVPVMVAAFYVVKSTGQRERAIAYRQAERWARTLSDNQIQILHGTRAILMTLANTDAVAGVTKNCASLTRDLLRGSPQYANLGVIELDGKLSCSARPAPATALGDRHYFQQAVNLRTFVGGDHQIDRVTRQPTINYAYPVLDERGAAKRIVFAALDLRWLSEWVARASLPPGTAVLMVDSVNVLVYRYPQAAGYIGTRLSSTPLRQLLRTEGLTTIADAPGLDGVSRIYAAVSVPRIAGTSPLRLLVGIPESEAFAFSHGLGRRAFWFMLFLLGGTIALAWLLGDRFIVRRIGVIYEGTQRLAAGDLDSRIGVTGGKDELTALAVSFDAMAAALQRNQQNNQFLADASHVLASSLDHERILRTLAELCVQRFADWCAIDLRLRHNGRAGFHYIYHSDREKRRQARLIETRYPNDPADMRNPNNEVIRSGKPVLIRHVSESTIAQTAQDAEHEQLLRSLGLRSLMILPMQIQSEVIGTLTLVSAETSREFDQTDVQLAEELARRAALAVENAQLYTEMEERVRARTSELTAVNHELEAFSYSVSHDLRSPLRSLDGFSQALAEDYAGVLDAQGRDFLQRIRGAAQRMGQLIDDLLSLSRVARMDLVRSDVDVTHLAEGVVRELRHSEPNRDVEMKVQADLRAAADPGLLRIVLQNLLSNAWKFSSKTSESRIEVGSIDFENEAVFYVRDNGAGFDMTYADKLFGPFQRLHGANEFAGTGIGLATVQRIIARHGGRIWAESAPDQGATFYFTLGPS